MSGYKPSLFAKTRGLISIDETGNEIQFFFTDAAIDLFRQEYIVLDSEVAESIKDAILSNNAHRLMASPESISNLLDKMESQILCEQFIKNTFPRLSIERHSIGKISIETVCYHCKPDPCRECITAMRVGTC